MKEKYKVKIITNLTGEIKNMSVEELIDYLQKCEVEEVMIKKVEKNSTD